MSLQGIAHPMLIEKSVLLTQKWIHRIPLPALRPCRSKQNFDWRQLMSLTLTVHVTLTSANRDSLADPQRALVPLFIAVVPRSYLTGSQAGQIQGTTQATATALINEAASSADLMDLLRSDSDVSKRVEIMRAATTSLSLLHRQNSPATYAHLIWRKVRKCRLSHELQRPSSSSGN